MDSFPNEEGVSHQLNIGSLQHRMTKKLSNMCGSVQEVSSPTVISKG
jgi:hypothetical protein